MKICHDKQLPKYDRIIVYLHGFPDLSVNPLTNEFASRFASKMNTEVAEKIPHSIFVCFNFSGSPGDKVIKFEDKTISQEVKDAKDVIKHVSTKFDCNTVHVIGLSTGAIVGCLLRDTLQCVKSITVIASLLDVKEGIKYDFTEKQLSNMDALGYCLKEFYLPPDCHEFASRLCVAMFS